jgi:hypothetical protein
MAGVICRVLLAALPAAVPALSVELRLRVVGEDGRPAPARLEVRGAGAMYGCADAVPSAAKPWTPGRPFYAGSFVVEGGCSVDVPAGSYIVAAERGLEYERLEHEISVGTEAVEIKLQPRRWINMRELSWWSADFHIHRDPEHVPLLARAEDLNLSVVFTIWNRRSYWSAERPPPKNAITSVAPHRLVSLMNAEDERGGGAWMLHGLPEPLDISVPGRWYPPGLKFIRIARAVRPAGGVLPWFDSEKLIWWETPVVVALETPDSAGVVHNHFHQQGGLDTEAWGRPRDRQQYPGLDGLMRYSMDLYYRYLNLGFRMAPSAGPASGVMPSPVGYSRVYARMSGAFTAANWYAALKRGPAFVTNGPMLFAELDTRGGRAVLRVNAEAREEIHSIEAVANGRVIGRKEAPANGTRMSGDFPVNVSAHTWVAARCFLKTRETPRFAHSSPIYLGGRWDAEEDALYFITWIDELIQQTESDPKRFASGAEREEVLSLYRQARRIYEEKSRPAQ